MRPYKQLQTQEYIYRKFTQDIPEEELVWHRDQNDREVEILEPTDWMFQFDNELPQTLNGKLFIPKETYHRLIKGTGYLNIRIKNTNGTGHNSRNNSLRRFCNSIEYFTIYN